ncbi:superoxide dismutase [Anaerotruncus rubiinfantis]|uniref:superoxide dismutase n=1 Tax=Anaerotruncus rubiinfantis TaxID=1720200 RepID=UPI003D78EACC
MYEHYPFDLAPLPYPCDALAPCISPETVKLHHGKHQAGYVEKLNAALENCPKYHCWPLERLLCECPQLPKNLQLAVQRNAGGVYAHELYFDGMTPSPVTSCPTGRLAKAIDCCFTSFECFKDVMTQTALDQFGSGWCWLCCEPDGKLRVLSTANQDTPLSMGLRPVIALDVWEHAYYLDYQNKRKDYVQNWWNLVDWEFAEQNYLLVFEKNS